MPRVLCVWFPRWPIQRIVFERPELKPSEVVLFANHNQRPAVTACHPRAEQSGIHIGQPLAEAKVLLPEAEFLAADEAADRALLCRLAADGQRFSPLVGLEEGQHPEALLCDVTGCTHLWNGEEPFAQAVRHYWAERGFFIHLALAGTVGAAWALAHTTAHSILADGDEASALANFPVAVLRLPGGVVDQLHALGLATIGAVLQLPRDSLASRFGVILPQRLDQLLGLLPETFLCERLQDPLAVVREWEVPIADRLALAFLCRQMLNELLSQAERHGAGLQELVGEIRTEDGPVNLEIRLVEPTQEEAHLAGLLELQLERRTWSGGVLAVRWTAERLGRVEQVQGSWLENDAARDRSRAFKSLVDRLGSRLDPTAVLKVEMVADSQPEHVVRNVPWTDPARRKADECSLSPEESRARPVRLLSVPQAIGVSSVMPDGPPIHMVCAGQTRRVIRSWGPERIATGWWRGEDVERDYYRAELEDGSWVWIYHEQRGGRWWLHGFFD
jgi:protein ImuB